MVFIGEWESARVKTNMLVTHEVYFFLKLVESALKILQTTKNTAFLPRFKDIT